MLDWSRFEQLAGDATSNFEKLCRGIVCRHFGSLGALKELKNQPGVEYHIELNKNDPRLGTVGQIVGWQCKWFQYRASGELTSSDKKQILHSLGRTKKHLPSLNVWILWTHKTLAKVDQDWFYALKKEYGFELHLWNEEHLNSYLSGIAVDLRHSYFGELALTPEMLLEQHKISVAPIKKRWLHEVHQKTDIEQTVRKILGEASAWDAFDRIATDLIWVSNNINAALQEASYMPWQDELRSFDELCSSYVNSFGLFKTTICGEQITQVKSLFKTVNLGVNEPIRVILREFRRRNLPLSLVLTNALVFIKDAKKQLKMAYELFSHQLIAVVADAGGGKTQFSAELTAASDSRAAGVLILGRDLKSGATLDDLAKRISFYASPLQNFECLVIALDALGTRSGYRIPIVIDGLNEAEDPREWKPLLASAQTILDKYSNVVLICTLRTGEKKRNYPVRITRKKNSREDFAHKGLPDDCFVIESKGFSEKVTYTAIRAYFKHYKISADPFIAPRKFFRHPLNLKIFCEVTNREAKEVVHVTHFPSSIYSLFKAQVDHTADTIANMTNLSISYKTRDIDDAIYFIGEIIWQEAHRSIPEKYFRERLGMGSTNWVSDLVNLLAQEGLIFRDEVDRREFQLTPAYDRLGGYFVANYLLQKYSVDQEYTWLNDESLLTKLFGEPIEQHELSQDVLHALVALFPKYNRKNLWQCLPDDYDVGVIDLSHLIDVSDIDTVTIQAYKDKIIEEGVPRHSIEKLNDLKTVIKHPFNADFFNELLSELSMADRDLSWTEYVRLYSQDIIDSLKQRIKLWKNKRFGESEAERLRALSISWLLTSSCIELRDKATEALFYYGLHYCKSLLDISINKLTVNDPYITERLLAACYGIIGTLLPKGKAEKEIAQFSELLFKLMFCENAEAPTSHLLAREYASCIVDISNNYIPSLLNDDQVSSSLSPFSSMPRKEWDIIKSNKEEVSSRVDSPFRMDFENYTIGRLVSDRGNYNFDHPEYQVVRGKILWRVYDLGWESEKFKEAERRIQSSGSYERGYQAKVERYGKKYSWIAYYEVAGELQDIGKIEGCHERFDADIDPFFPKAINETVKEKVNFLGDDSISTDDWIVHSEIPDLNELTILNEASGEIASWVLLKGHVTEESKRLDRNFYCSMRMFFIESSERQKLQKYNRNNKKVEWPEQQQSTYIFSGEIYEKSSAYFDEVETIQVTVGTESHEVEYPKVSFEENSISIGEMTKHIVDKPIYDEVSIKCPVVGYYWEFTGRTTSSLSCDLLAPWLVSVLGLTFDATERSYMDAEGKIATQSVVQQEKEFSDDLELFYLRKDLFEELLRIKQFEFCYKVYGERRVADIDSLHSGKTKITYNTFENILFLGTENM